MDNLHTKPGKPIMQNLATRLQLKPAGLGAVEIDVSRTGTEQASVTIRADNPVVVSALREGRAELAATFRQVGIPAAAQAVMIETAEGAVARPTISATLTATSSAVNTVTRASAAVSVPNAPSTQAEVQATSQQTVAATTPAGTAQVSARTLAPVSRVEETPAPLHPASAAHAAAAGKTTATAGPEKSATESAQAGVDPLLAARPIAETRIPIAVSDPMPMQHAETAHSSHGHSAQANLASNLAGQIRGNPLAEGTTRIELVPKGLGSLEIDLAHDDNGALRITIRAENPAVLGALRENRDMLLSVLRDSGVSVQNGSLGFEEFGRGPRQHQQAEPIEYRPRAKDDAIAEDISPLDAVVQSGRVDIIT